MLVQRALLREGAGAELALEGHLHLGRQAVPPAAAARLLGRGGREGGLVGLVGDDGTRF